jgi:hypothetical protein
VTGWARGDGTNNAAILQSTGSIAGAPWIGTTSTVWQKVDGEYTATGPRIALYSGATVGNHAEYDNLAVQNLSATTLNCLGSLGNLAQATAASMGWTSDPLAPTSVPLNGRRVLYFDGVADHYESNQAAATWNFLHNGSDFLATVVWKNTSYPALWSQILGTITSAGTATGLYIWARNSNQVSVGIRNGALSSLVHNFTVGGIALGSYKDLTLSKI